MSGTFVLSEAKPPDQLGTRLDRDEPVAVLRGRISPGSEGVCRIEQSDGRNRRMFRRRTGRKRDQLARPGRYSFSPSREDRGKGRRAGHPGPGRRARPKPSQAEPKSRVLLDRIPATSPQVFLPQRVNQFRDPFGFNFADILFKMALGIVSSDDEHANDNEQAIQQKSQKYFMPEFKVHAKPPVAGSFRDH